MKIKNKLVILASVVVTTTVNLNAMPGAAHDRLGGKLLAEPPSKGAEGLTFQNVKAINRWMDNPATKTGQYMNRSTGSLVHPRNHGMLRHNPDAVSRAMSGTGKIDPAIKSVARVHKIADISHNSAPVDGWPITKEMKDEAQKIVSHVEEKGHLPKKLPKWVDESGPLLKTKGLTVGTKITKAAPIIGLVVETGIRGVDAYATEQKYKEGRISENERGSRHAENVGGMVGGVSGTAAGAALGAAIGAPFGGIGAIPGAIIGGIFGAIGGGVAGDYVGAKSGRTLYEIAQ